MIHLRSVIAVREIPPNASRIRCRLPSIAALVSDSRNEEETHILRYLQQGVFGAWYPDPGLEYDVLQNGVKISLQTSAGAPNLLSII